MEEVSARSSTPEVQREGGEYGSKVTGVMTTKKPGDEGGRTDLLLRFFDSSFFNEWIALTYVPNQSTHIYIYSKKTRARFTHTHTNTHVRAHMCVRESHESTISFVLHFTLEGVSSRNETESMLRRTDTIFWRTLNTRVRACMCVCVCVNVRALTGICGNPRVPACMIICAIASTRSHRRDWSHISSNSSDSRRCGPEAASSAALSTCVGGLCGSRSKYGGCS